MGREARSLPLMWIAAAVTHLCLVGGLFAVNEFLGSSFAHVAVGPRKPAPRASYFQPPR